MCTARKYILFCLLSVPVAIMGQSDVFNYFYVSNILAPTQIDSEENSTNIEVLLSPDASLTKVPIQGELLPAYSFLSNITSFPVNFSTQHTQFFQVGNGTSVNDVSLSVKQVKRRTAPFTLSFVPPVSPSIWSINTIGWVAKNIDESIKDAVGLKADNATFLLAWNNVQGLLKFEMEKPEDKVFDGIFTVEASAEGMEGSWRTLFIKDDCNNEFKEENVSVSIKLSEADRYVRFMLSNTTQNQLIRLNGFSVQPYNGEETGEFTSIQNCPDEDGWLVKSCIVSSFLEMELPSHITDWTCNIYDISGRMIKSLSNQKVISVTELLPGSYILSIQTSNKQEKIIKFIKK